MRRCHLACFIGCLLFFLSSVAPAADDSLATDVLKDKGLTKAGTVYILPDETAILDDLKVLRDTKKAADKETLARRQVELKTTAAKKTIKDGIKEHHELDGRMGVTRDAQIRDRIAVRMNALAAKVNETTDKLKDLEEQLGKLSIDAKIKYVDDLAGLATKVDTVTEKYNALTQNAAVKSAVAKLNTTANPATLGPSPQFIAGAADVRKWRSEVESEAIPMQESNGVHSVDVMLNGSHYTMMVDTGASSVILPAETAEKLKMVPGDQDPTVQLKLADGRLLEGKRMTLKTVRVGRFTVENVDCVVLEKGLPDPATILGNSFLSHFIVKLNQGANQLFLTELGDGKSKAAPSAGLRSSDSGQKDANSKTPEPSSN